VYSNNIQIILGPHMQVHIEPVSDDILVSCVYNLLVF